MDYTLPKSVDAIENAIKTALKNIQPNEKEGYYLNGSSFANGPGRGKGIHVSPAEDLLRQIL